MAENAGRVGIVTFDGPGAQNATIQTIKEGLESTPGVTATRGIAWIVEGKLNDQDDPKLKDKDPGLFKNVRNSASQAVGLAAAGWERGRV